MMDRWRVHKFGGSSVADAACMQRVGRILEDETSSRLAVILSACRGVTDALLGLVTASEQREEQVAAELDMIRQRHVTIAEALLTAADASEYIARLDADCRDILGIVHAVHLTRSASAAIRDVVAGFGEIWSTRLFASYFAAITRRPGAVHWVDARDVIEVEWGALGPAVRWVASRANAERVTPRDPAATLIITGV